jgi:succinate dehydrogenase / fumarate reductase cytochrome b subunit
MMEKTRPKYLNLLAIRLPLPGWVSILHRASGAGLHSRSSFAYFQSTVANPMVKLVLFGLLWAFLHHLFAGIRYIAMDLHWGVELGATRKTSAAVLAVSLILTLVLGARLLW